MTDTHSDHDHDHAHGHGHAHGPGGHVHAPADFGRAFAIGIALNVGFVAVEAVCGVLANSVALLADAERHGLLVTGSSDYHGRGKPNRLGEHLTMPEALAEIERQATGTAVLR